MFLNFIGLNTWQVVALLVIGVLLFGSRLPSIARSLGKSVVEFKKGVKDVKDDLDVSKSSDEPKKLEDKSEENAAKREVTAEKVEKSEAEKVSS